MDSHQGINVNVNSEIGKLQHVLVHAPGPELEKVTPENAHTFLFSDILNMQVAQKEYGYFKRVLQKVAHVHEIGDLLTDILQDSRIKNSLVDRICKAEERLIKARRVAGEPLTRRTGSVPGSAGRVVVDGAAKLLCAAQKDEAPRQRSGCAVDFVVHHVAAADQRAYEAHGDDDAVHDPNEADSLFVVFPFFGRLIVAAHIEP